MSRRRKAQAAVLIGDWRSNWFSIELLWLRPVEAARRERVRRQVRRVKRRAARRWAA